MPSGRSGSSTSLPGTYTWIPFGGGRRRCLGASFAIQEMKVVLKAIMARYDVAPARTAPELNRRRSITISPGRGAEAVLHARTPAAQPSRSQSPLSRSRHRPDQFLD